MRVVIAVAVGLGLGCIGEADAASRHRHRAAKRPHVETGVPVLSVEHEIAKLTPELIRAYVARRIAAGEYEEAKR
jgi:hypothetical protein